MRDNVIQLPFRRVDEINFDPSAIDALPLQPARDLVQKITRELVEAINKDARLEGLPVERKQYVIAEIAATILSSCATMIRTKSERQEL